MFPTTWTLDFKKDSKWNISVYSALDPKDKLSIKYKKYTTEIIPGNITQWYNYYNFKNVFNFAEIDSLFNDPKVLSNLAKLEDNKVNKLNAFLYNAWRDIDVDWDIDEIEYNKASSILKDILWKNYAKITEILGNGTIDSKVLLINRMKWIFATEESVTNWKLLGSIIDTRREAYKQLSWPSNEIIPSFASDYRKNILEKLSNQSNLSQNIDDALVGYTAFYRKWTNEWRWFSLTAPWATKVLWWEKIAFEKNDEILARNRFIKNLKIDKVSMSIITKSINDKIPKAAAIYWSLSESNIIDLLSWKSLDIWWENNITISLNSAMSFYLLWECANESIGIKIDWISIKSKRWTWLLEEARESYAWEITPSDNYVWWIEVSSRNLSVPMVPWAYEHDIWINSSGRDKERKSSSTTDPSIIGPSTTDPWITGP